MRSITTKTPHRKEFPGELETPGALTGFPARGTLRRALPPSY
jgi:hypothetical protein